jgi:uncharacterized protein DUF6884
MPLDSGPAAKFPGATLCLVSCVSKKRATAARARDLYQSQWFLKARGHVEGLGHRWFVLSAEYGLLDPDRVVEPYERTLNTMPIAERRLWAARVMEQLAPELRGVERVLVFAGDRYREFLLPAIRAGCPLVEVPMNGLRIGEQLRWLAQQTKARS